MNTAGNDIVDRLGIFARTFARPSLGEILDQVKRHGLRLVQLNLSSTGRPTLPESLTSEDCAKIRQAFDDRGLTIAAVSGTFNVVDPDRERRESNLQRLDLLASRLPDLGCSLLTLCSGTRHPEDMWASHPDNALPETWLDLVETMKRIAAIAEAHRVTFAFEPEAANVVDSLAKARKLLDAVGSPRLKVVLDVANLLQVENMLEMHETIHEAFVLIGSDIALVHAKEIARDGKVGDVAPGRGILDFACLFRYVLRMLPDVPIILHGLKEEHVSEGLDHLKLAMGTASDATLIRDGVTFRFRELGTGLPVVFQHGLGGDLTVPWSLYQPGPGVRLLSFDARFHGETYPATDPEGLSFDTFADDLLALLDMLYIEKAVIGGISMGAGLSLNFALRYPERTLGLILSRPAWLDEPFPENVRMFPVMGDFIRRLGAEAGHRAFRESPTYAQVRAESTDSAAALDGMFLHPRAEETVDKFDRIPHDCPSRDRGAWKAIRVPTLILANHQDPIHPWAMGVDLAETIPGAELRELTPKCVDIPKHNADVHRHITEFLDRHFLNGRAD